MTTNTTQTLDPEAARRFFEGKIVRIFDSGRLWTRCERESFLEAIGAHRFVHNAKPHPGARFIVTGLKLYEPSGWLYACLEDTNTNQHFLCNVRGLEITATSNTKENTMNTTITSSTTIIESRTYVFGNDINNMTPDQMIVAIQAVEKAIADMKATKTKSEYITNRIKSMTEDLAKIAAVLDAK